MNQDNNFNQNNFNSQRNNGISNNQPQPTPSFQQPIIQEPMPQPMNTFDSGNANNQSFNSKPPKKMNLGLIIGIVVGVAVIGGAIIFGSKLLSNDNNNPNTNDNDVVENNTNNDNNDEEQKEDSNFYETWGASERWVAVKSGTNAWETKPFYINFPKYRGYTEGHGLVAEQVDGTTVIVASEYENSPVVNALKDFMPAYSNDLIYTLESIFGIMSENFEIHINNDKAVTVGKYDMHSFNGTFSFDEDGAHYEYQCVIYATQLKSNGAYAYWVVYDTSDNQSNGKLIAEHAYNMAKTFREEN